MQKSLKKQIFQNKVLNFIKTHSIIFFFATFDLPQKKRGEFKKQINIILEKKHGGSVASKAPFGRYDPKDPALVPGPTSQARTFLSKKKVPYLSPYPGFPSSTLMEKNINTVVTLHISNKCFQNLIKNHNLPLYGQTLIIAVPREEDLVFFSTLLSLYKGILLGGFYKKKPQTKSYLNALCKCAHKKNEVHKGCLDVLSVTSRNLQKTTRAVCLNCLRLLNHISQGKKNI